MHSQYEVQYEVLKLQGRHSEKQGTTVCHLSFYNLTMTDKRKQVSTLNYIIISRHVGLARKLEHKACVMVDYEPWPRVVMGVSPLITKTGANP
jgi:hypothetical protein